MSDNVHAKLAPWPICTVPGCGHVLSHDNVDDLQAVLRENREAWISSRGSAVCRCHPDPVAVSVNVLAFDCDVSWLNMFGGVS